VTDLCMMVHWQSLAINHGVCLTYHKNNTCYLYAYSGLLQLTFLKIIIIFKTLLAVACCS
jgi:hypothetical protein